jgi:hypothetical protein
MNTVILQRQSLCRFSQDIRMIDVEEKDQSSTSAQTQGAQLAESGKMLVGA